MPNPTEFDQLNYTIVNPTFKENTYACEVCRMESKSYYEAISRHYDAIFPMNPLIRDFLAEHAGTAPVEIIDIACGNAAYSLALCRMGYRVTGIDLDAGMIAAAKRKAGDAGGPNGLHLLQGDMLALRSMELEPAALAFCIGNSMVHLPNPETIGLFLKEAHHVITGGGSIVLQIINYDRILKDHITSLPTLSFDNPNNMPVGDVKTTRAATFERLYVRSNERMNDPVKNPDLPLDQSDSTPELPEHPDYPGLLPNKTFLFHTRLTVDGQVYESRIPLFPLQSEVLKALLAQAGFRNVCLYGDFKKSPYDPDTSYALIATAIA